MRRRASEQVNCDAARSGPRQCATHHGQSDDSCDAEVPSKHLGGARQVFFVRPAHGRMVGAAGGAAVMEGSKGQGGGQVAARVPASTLAVRFDSCVSLRLPAPYTSNLP